jgi:hypothetical protein
MGKLNNRIVAFILMACWCSLVYTGDWRPEHRGVVTESPDTSWGKVIFFVLYVVLNEVGKYLDEHSMGGYTCPDICDVDHKHIRRPDERIVPEETEPHQEGAPKHDGSVIASNGE